MLKTIKALQILLRIFLIQFNYFLTIFKVFQSKPKEHENFFKQTNSKKFKKLILEILQLIKSEEENFSQFIFVLTHLIRSFRGLFIVRKKRKECAHNC
jgi:hypothetical protein